MVHLATEIKDLFAVNGSPLRLQQLEAAFNAPPHYGKGIDWSGSTVHDAASIMLRFLLCLPEPIIPLGNSEAFQDPLRAGRKDSSDSTLNHNQAIRKYQEQFALLPAFSRHLLLYLLSLLAIFASESESNNLTAERLATIFQPAILSPVSAGEASRRLSRDVLTYLIVYHEELSVGLQYVS